MEWELAAGLFVGHALIIPLLARKWARGFIVGIIAAIIVLCVSPLLN